MSIAIFMYHAIGTAADPDGAEYAISADVFAAQLAALRAAGIPLVPADSPASWPGRGVALTFDDGEESALVAAELLSSVQASATFFVTPGRLGTPGYLSAAQLRELDRAGFRIGAHGQTHRLWNMLEEPELSHELLAPRRYLEDLLGRPVTLASAPGGRCDPRARRLAALAGYRLLFTSRPGLASPRSAPLALPRFAIRRGMTEERVLELALGQPLPRLLLGGRYAALQFARRLLGEPSYRSLLRRVRG